MADYVTTAKFGMTLSEPGEFSKYDYMTTAHFFRASIKIFGVWMADYVTTAKFGETL